MKKMKVREFLKKNHMIKFIREPVNINSPELITKRVVYQALITHLDGEHISVPSDMGYELINYFNGKNFIPSHLNDEVILFDMISSEHIYDWLCKSYSIDGYINDYADTFVDKESNKYKKVKNKFKLKFPRANFINTQEEGFLNFDKIQSYNRAIRHKQISNAANTCIKVIRNRP